MTLEISISVNEMEQIKEKIFEKMGLDLSYYKSTFLERRINVRMKILNVSSGSEYAELLNYEPDEVTSFRAQKTVRYPTYLELRLCFWGGAIQSSYNV
jgi:chemotaxis methyl-accepting protein methylase